MSNSVSLEDVQLARATIAPHICTTPAECFQVTGSFKIRGASFAVHKSLQQHGGGTSPSAGVYTHRDARQALDLSVESMPRPSIGFFEQLPPKHNVRSLCSSGNHGAALAHAAKTAGASATIIMPKTAPACKVAAARSAGATVLMCGPSMQSRQDAATAHAESHPQDKFIPPYNHPDIIAGQGTVGLELLQQVAEGGASKQCLGPHTESGLQAVKQAAVHLDAVVVPVSGGGLISGIATAVKASAPRCKVIGAEPLGTNNMADAAACKTAGELVQLPEAPDTIADGLRAALGDVTWPIVRDRVDAIIPVTEEAILHAMRLLMDKAKLVVEPSGAAGLAAVLSERFLEEFGSLKNVAVVLSGSNVDFERVKFWQEWGECAGLGGTGAGGGAPCDGAKGDISAQQGC